MSDTPNRGIPYVPEGTLDPAAGLNISLNVLDALVQTRVISMTENGPPTTPEDGDMYIVDSPGVGAWAELDDCLVRYVADGDFWQFFRPGTQVSLIIDQDTGTLQYYSTDSPGGWAVIGTIPDAPSNGTQYARKNGAWDAIVIPATRETVSALTISSNTITMNYALGDYFTVTLTANITTLSFSNLPGSGKGATLMLKITQGSGPYTFAWPASFKWAGGAAPSISTANGAIDVLAITTFDNGTTWDATLAKAFA